MTQETNPGVAPGTAPSAQSGSSNARTPAEIALIYERGRTSMAMGYYEHALRIMRQVTRLAPDHAGGWRNYAALLRHAARDAEAVEAGAQAILAPADAWRSLQGPQDAAELRRLDEELQDQLRALPEDQRAGWLRERLTKNPLDVAALRYLADEENSAGDSKRATDLLLRAVELSPAYLGGRAAYATLLAERRDYMAAYHQCAFLLAAAPDEFGYRLLRADCAMNIDRVDEAKPLYDQLLREKPMHPALLRSYGFLMNTVGNRDEAARTYRSLLAQYPNAGAGYYGLNELRANYLTGDDVAQMRQRLSAGVPNRTSRRYMAYALAQTLEGMGEYEASFRAYEFAAGVSAEIARESHWAYDPAEFAQRLNRMRRSFTAGAIATRAAAAPPNPATTPIFVMGMPRAGSTLVEQILASHDQIEGTRELPVVSEITGRIAMSRLLVAPDVYPDRVLEYSRAELDRFGADILGGMAEFRRTKLPYVIDKRPGNWVDAPFLHLVLPQAKFIEVRRAPMAACFAMFKQMLRRDAAFSYNLTHLGRFYRDYVDYMDYLDSVMPGAILRVSYESLVDNTEAEIRRMLDYCGLPFDERCLRFWETDRAVLTPSAQQVRKPIYRGALEQWKNFEPWLGELKAALGDLA
ncbi:MAG TPA: sulfotransferase [Rhizomicrobium sp.]|nr:sulfotransferase [Rhizomicrobium sp.]